MSTDLSSTTSTLTGPTPRPIRFTADIPAWRTLLETLGSTLISEHPGWLVYQLGGGRVALHAASEKQPAGSTALAVETPAELSKAIDAAAARGVPITLEESEHGPAGHVRATDGTFVWLDSPTPVEVAPQGAGHPEDDESSDAAGDGSSDPAHDRSGDAAGDGSSITARNRSGDASGDGSSTTAGDQSGDASGQAARSSLSVLPIWYGPDIGLIRGVLEGLGARPRIVGDAGTWTDLTFEGGGLSAVHAAEQPGVELSFEWDGDVEEAQQLLEAVGIDCLLIDETYSRTLQIADPDGGKRVWINERQTDLYGYRDASGA